MIPLRRTLVLAAFAALAVVAHSQTTVYTNPGNSTSGFTVSGLNLATRTDNGETWIGDTGGYGFGAGTATLSLSGLQAHSSVTIAFDLYMTGSEDGNGPAGGATDSWSLSQTGSTTSSLIATSFANFGGGGNMQSFGGSNGAGGYLVGPLTYGGGTYAPRTGQSAANHLGFGAGDFGDATYSLSFTFPSTSAAQSFAFTSGLNEGNGNEGWGLDNIRVSIVPVNATPEPASLAALGLGALALVRRRRRA